MFLSQCTLNMKYTFIRDSLSVIIVKNKLSIFNIIQKKFILFPANFSTGHLLGDEPPCLEAARLRFLVVDQSPRPPKMLPRCCGRGSWGKGAIKFFSTDGKFYAMLYGTNSR